MSDKFTVAEAKPREAKQWGLMGVPINSQGRTIKTNSGYKGTPARPKMPRAVGRRR